ncbi:hypothetical protein B0H14DRAFT_2989807, partial [Mycena olivaceomarginata]
QDVVPPILAFIFTLSFTKLPPVTAVYYPAHLGGALPGSVLAFLQHYVPSPNAIFHTQELMEDAAARSKDLRDKIGELKARMDSIVHAATALHELQKLRIKRRESDDGDDSPLMFPAPNKAPGHEDRRKVVSLALEKAGAELKTVCGKHGMDEESIENMVVLLVGASLDYLNILTFVK